MDFQDFISNEKFKDINKEIERIEEERRRNGFNLFTISSYNTYLENFHSDITALLFNSKERHGQGTQFFKLFLSFLNSLGANIDENQYNNYEVLREKGRIDIWIIDNSSKKSIIIENKINNAFDQENQLKKYYDYASDKGYEVDSIVYLTLKGNKKAPIMNHIDIDGKVIDIEAFSQTGTNLCDGWLQKCYDASKENKDEDSSSFVYQYIKLIKHLSQIVMDNQIKKDFYEVVSNEENRKKAKLLSSLLNDLETFRMDLFMEKIGNNYAPFTKIYRYKSNHQFFKEYKEGGISYQLDVHFYPDKSCLDFWIPELREDKDKVEKYISDKLKEIGLLDKFNCSGFGYGMYKIFKIEEYNNIKTIDEEIYKFVNIFFEKLKTHPQELPTNP